MDGEVDHKNNSDEDPDYWFELPVVFKMWMKRYHNNYWFWEDLERLEIILAAAGEHFLAFYTTLYWFPFIFWRILVKWSKKKNRFAQNFLGAGFSKPKIFWIFFRLNLKKTLVPNAVFQLSGIDVHERIQTREYRRAELHFSSFWANFVW